MLLLEYTFTKGRNKMKHSLKKATALLCSAMLCGTMATTSVFADNVTLPYNPQTSTDSSSDVDMQTALTKVKQRIDIPEEYSEFDYSTGQYNGTVSYTFSWETSDGSKSIRAVIVDNIITNYRCYDSTENYDGYSFGKLTAEQLKAKANAAVLKLNPSFRGCFTSELNYASLNGNDVSFSAYRTQNGVKVDSNSLSIVVDKNTGKLIRFSTSWWGNAKFEGTADALNVSQAADAFTEQIELEPIYRIVRDYDKYTQSAVLLYTPKDYEPINAKTGKPSTMSADRKNAEDTGAYGDALSGASETMNSAVAPATDGESGRKRAVEFTDAEKKALISNKTLITKEDAEKKVRADKYILCEKSYMLESASLNKNNFENSYSWYLSFVVNTKGDYRSLYATLDAKTGEIMSFSRYDNSKPAAINDTSATKLAKEVLASYLGKRADEYKLSDKSDDYAVYNSDKKPTVKSFNYTRFVNGIACNDNTARVTVNGDGKVTEFGYSYSNIQFPSADRITEDKAMTSLFTQRRPELVYDGFSDRKGNVKTYLLYTLESFCLNAKTGKLCDSSGEEIVEKSNGTIEYTDLGDCYAEKYINKLAQYGVTLETKDGKFRPDDVITEADFRKLMNSISSSRGTDASKYTAKFITREKAAVIFITAINCDKVAQIKGIFKSNFKDVSESSANIGYIACACGMNVMSADNSGKFRPTEKLTRAGAMELAYRYLANGTN